MALALILSAGIAAGVPLCCFLDQCCGMTADVEAPRGCCEEHPSPPEETPASCDCDDADLTTPSATHDVTPGSVAISVTTTNPGTVRPALGREVPASAHSGASPSDATRSLPLLI
jgi:hypothetical protein